MLESLVFVLGLIGGVIYTVIFGGLTRWLYVELVKESNDRISFIGMCIPIACAFGLITMLFIELFR